jgi:hypothetical protein
MAIRVQSLGDSSVILVQSPGIACRLFGVPFLAIGLFAPYAYFVHVVPSIVTRGAITQAMLAAIPLLGGGLMFGVAGSAFVFGRSTALIDKTDHSVSIRTRILFWSRTRSFHFRDSKDFAVLVKRRAHGSSHWVTLTGAKGRSSALHFLGASRYAVERAAHELQTELVS